MQTKDSPDKITALPPPPAPPARDANPWPMQAPAASAGGRPQDPVSVRRPRRHGRNEGRHKALAVVAALAVLLGILVQTGRGGDIGELAGALFALFIMVMIVVTRLRRARKPAGRDAPGDEAG